MITPRRRRFHGGDVPAVGVISAAGVALVLVAIAVVFGPQDDAGPPTARSAENRATQEQVEARTDQFGISYLKRTRPGGTYWVSDWDSPRQFHAIDPVDEWFDADHGTAMYEAGAGELRITGPTARMYVHDPAGERQWRDVEVTMYFKRVDDAGTPFAGMTAVARSNHLSTEDAGELCDTRGYGGRMRFDGSTDFEKETAHPRNEAHGTKELFPGGMPYGVWLGYKFLVFDQPDGVHLQLWLDRTGGVDGGGWDLVNEMVDDGHVFGDVACAPGIDPQMMLTNDGHRAGSESGRPNISVYFRSDDISQDGLVYKWGSVREIVP
ncbi:MAG: hypothetical protein ACXWW7_05040 [Nocardioides sp.]